MSKLYPQRYDGEWITVKNGFHRFRCCDCGLVHQINFRARKGKVEFQPFRDNRATGQSRRYKKIALKTGERKTSISRQKVKESVLKVISKPTDK